MSPWWIAAIAASVGAGVIHLALGPEHLEELGTLGLGFYLSAGLQLGWAMAVAFVLWVGRASRLLRALAGGGIAINGAILAAWAFSRLVGLPAGETPWVPEAIGPADAVSAVLESGLVLGLAAWLRGAPVLARPRTVRGSLLAAALAVAVIGAGTAFGLNGEPHSHGADAVHEGEPATMDHDALHDAVEAPHAHVH